MAKQVRSIRERLLSRYEVDTPTGCWLFTGAKATFGYGMIRVGGKTVGAHRVSYKLHKGTIPEGMSVCHSCDTPACINPDHLWLGTTADNLRDMKEKGRADKRAGENHHLARLTEEDIRRIRNDPRAQHIIAKDYSVGHDHISRIKSRKSWSHI